MVRHMIPISITLQDFGSFKKKQTFVFPKGPGLFFMWGDNQLEPRLEGNGAGKSTVWKALTWLFYGKTAEGLKAGDISNWEVGKNAQVHFSYDLDTLGERRCTISRTWQPNSWKLVDEFGEIHDLAKDNTNRALADLRLEFAAFLQSVLMPQGSELFLEMKSDKQAELFSEVMGLEKWLRASTRASERARAEDSMCRDLESDLARMEGRLHDVMETAQLRHLEGVWKKQQDDRLYQIEEDYALLLEQKKASEIELLKAEGEAERALAAYESRRVVVSEASMLVREVRADVDAAQANATAAEAVRDMLQAQYQDLLSHKYCPTCGGDLGKHDQEDFAMRVDEKTQAFADASEKLLVLMDELAVAVAEMDKVSEGIRQLDVGSSDAAARARNIRNKCNVGWQLDKMESDAERIVKEANPYTRLIEEADATASRLRVEHQAIAKALDASRTRFAAASGWVRWFKDIRLAEIGEALEQLELEVNNQVTACGLIDWYLKFDVDKETASGTIKRGFAVSVQSPSNMKPVPWEAWSGGEKQRLIDAAQMGLSNLIRARTGATIPLEVWDEPTKGMSPRGVQDLLEALHTRAFREKRQIWVVDHTRIGFSKFTGSAGVIKTKAGSHFDISELEV